MSKTSKEWEIAAVLAFLGALNPFPVPLVGLHKFYLGQPLWGGIYLLLWPTQIPRIACAVEAVWYVAQRQQSVSGDKANQSQGVVPTPDGVAVSQQTQAIAAALRELEQLRQEGLISEQEFEQNRRHLLSQLG